MSEIYPEGSAVDTLERFAKETGRSFSKNEIPFVHAPLHPVTYHIRRVCIPYSDDREMFYISYGNSREYGRYANFSGIFFPIDLPDTTVIKIRNRDILDKINPFLKDSDFTSENDDFDNKVVIEENDIFSTKSLLNKEKLQEIIPEVFKYNQALNVGVNDVKIDFVEEINGKSHFGIYVLDNWIVKPEEIEFLFDKVKQIKTSLKF